MANMNEFLQQYFMQLRFDDMPAPVRAQFEEYVKKKDFIGNMKTWADKLLQKDPVSGEWIRVNGNYVSAPLPNPANNAELPADEAEKLYKAFQKTFRTMEANKGSFSENKDATAFLQEFFGPDRLFDNSVASPEAEIAIQSQLKPILEKNPALENILRTNGVLGDDFSLKDLRNAITNRDYNTNSKIRERVINAARVISYSVAYDAEMRAALGTFDFDDIINNFDSDVISPVKLQEFRNELPYILRQLHTKGKVRDVFSKNGGDKITKHYDYAVEKMAYGDQKSDDYVPPKRDDTLTPWQQLQDMVGKTYDQILGKYLKFKGDENFVSIQAKNIVDAMGKAKIKPTDGLGAIIKNADAIQKAVQYKSPRTTVKHCKWVMETLNELSATMPKAFAGALQNGEQLQAIVREVILKAAAEGKEEEAKTLLEVLSVSKYGLTTSKIMDALRQQDFTIFSDGKLSWNKQKAMQFVSKALDNSIKAAFVSIGYAVTMVGNAYRLSGSKFNGRGELAKKAKDWETQNDAEKQELINRQAQYRNDRDMHQQTLDGLDAQFGLNDNNINAKVSQLNAARQRLQDMMNSKDEYTQKAIQTVNVEIPRLQQEIQNLTNKGRQLVGEIRALRAELNAFQANKNAAHAAGDHTAEAAWQALIDDRNAKIVAKQAEFTASNNEKRTKNNELNNMANQVNQMVNAIQSIDRNSPRLERATNRTDMRVNAFTEAQNSVKFYDKQISKIQDQLNNWDNKHTNVIKRLMAHWDFLETGRITQTGPLHSWGLGSKKEHQEQFDKKKKGILQYHYDNYQLAA